ncbi:hypothetical protein D6C78_03187 [Aureobasidium pullulans]|uniref:Zn(2)-C6 fungal-type domain-containing protein n=1 Tax=Aureobasidium pullulans TaxID=5580 RepID=A0A4S8SFQ0_AURPU|nr:hypothetical protein D6D29_10096 [Aureobasidium pullulans]THZ71385.1 hypothetical protein D6C85_05320 [Aureobasidium pullulans]TIA01979.1 hypothetical protein D6C82_03200 [Aureobasidium pullulans]TIA39559.1 hypothetical protein D6C78_03187 [Aureobasidium pullulans]
MSPPVLGVARPLAPQPVRSADAAVLQPLQNTYPLKSTRSRRGTINAACHECRIKKLKCDGTRPRCRRCQDKGHDVCEYTVNPGETRFTALKRKNATLVTESDRMHKFIEALRSASPAQAQNMLQDLRTCDGAKDLLSTLTLSQSQPHELRHRESDSSVSSNNPSPPSMTTDTILTPHTSRSRSANSDGKLNPLLSQLSSNGFENESPSSTEATYQPFSDFERQLPSRGTLQECINSFHKEAGKLFHVFSLNHIESQFSVMYGQGDKQAQRVAACELSAVGALGSQYIRESQPEGTAQKMYSVAKHLLEDVVSVDATRAAKVCAMLGLFNIMSKEKVAMTFVEMGLNLLSRPQIAQTCPPNMERSEWTELRKTWRVLIFLETWLSSTLGYVSGLQISKELLNVKNLEIEGESDLEEKVTTEMIKIAVIKFDMLRLSLSFKGLSALMVGTITKDLQYWHQNLPSEMRLSELDNNPKISDELRRTIYYVNFLYSGAQIMLLRRVLQSLHERSNLLTGSETVVEELISQAKAAARESAKLFGRLYVEGGIIQRCWICIFQSYSSCVLILHHVAEVVLYEQHSREQGADPQADLDLALSCLQILNICREKDIAAGQFYSTLMPLYETLTATVIGQPVSQSAVYDAARTLHDLIRKPFKDSGKDSPQSQFFWKDEQQRHSQDPMNNDPFSSSDIANAPDPSLSCDSWQCIDGIKNDGMIHDLLSAIRPGHFLPGFESSAWGDSNQVF